MLTRGTTAPAFELPDDKGTMVRLADLLLGGPIVLYFYPVDFTPVCTRQACMFRDAYTEIENHGLRVFGVSPQAPEVHQRFRAQYRIPFPLLSDPDKVVIGKYEATGPFGLLVRRITYLIDTDGRIRDALQADLQVSRHRRFIERMVSKDG
jgi:peroxiredoxin Q/BCP